MARYSELQPMDAAYLQDYNPTCIFLSAKEILEELDNIQKAIESLHPKVLPVDLDEKVPLKDIAEIVVPLLEQCRFTFPPKSEDIQKQLNGASWLQLDSQTPLLNYCLIKCSLAIRVMADNHKIDTFLVAPVWHIRWQQLLMGTLHPAKVGFVSIYR
ncbi:hypothetical protein L9W80_09615 [Vibrio aestuarianus]|uniref:hypothetical protein n=1 Tax=Vibrio aestuarianus TaxID=28171 RepID=UPI00237C5B31|nr:hypothetical protein [Vibrio aestuarianus]MDE1350408.1 hypothetical protein [Vibrio aestuarianus]